MLPTRFSVRALSYLRNTKSCRMGIQIRTYLKLLTPSLPAIAEGLGVSLDTVKSWSSGRTDPSPENQQALAAFMRRHGKKLIAAAEQLEK